jgi:hypothetical protein
MISGIKVFNRSIKINSKRKTLGEKRKQHQIISSITGKLVLATTKIVLWHTRESQKTQQVT